MEPALTLYNDEQDAPARFLLPSKLPLLANGSAANASAAVPAWLLCDDDSGLTQFARTLLGIQRQVLLRVSRALHQLDRNRVQQGTAAAGTPGAAAPATLSCCPACSVFETMPLHMLPAAAHTTLWST